MGDAIDVFDPAAVRRHRARAAPDFGSHDFLVREIAERLAGRLDDVRRSFPVALDLGHHAALAAGRGGIGRVLRCGTVADHGPVAADEALLPFANASFDQAIACRPEFVLAHTNLGNLQKLLGRPDESAACFRRAIALKPDMAELRVNLGTALKAAGRLDAAADAYRAAVALDPGLAEAHRGLGITLADLGRDDAAEAALLRAIGLDPDAAAAHHDLAELLLRRGDATAAFAACDDCLAVDPGNSRALAVKAAALDERGARAAVRVLVDLDHLIKTTRFDAADGFADMAAFNAALADHVCNHPTRNFEPPNKATRLGTHTSEPMKSPS